MKSFTITFQEGENWNQLTLISTEQYDTETEARNRFNDSVMACINSCNSVSITLKSKLVKGGKLAQFNLLFPY